MSVRMSECISAAAVGRIFVKFGIGGLRKIRRENTEFVKIGQKYWGTTVYEDLSTFCYWRRH
jgi:hypothetical protein